MNARKKIFTYGPTTRKMYVLLGKSRGICHVKLTCRLPLLLNQIASANTWIMLPVLESASETAAEPSDAMPLKFTDPRSL